MLQRGTWHERTIHDKGEWTGLGIARAHTHTTTTMGKCRRTATCGRALLFTSFALLLVEAASQTTWNEREGGSDNYASACCDRRLILGGESCTREKNTQGRETIRGVCVCVCPASCFKRNISVVWECHEPYQHPWGKNVAHAKSTHPPPPPPPTRTLLSAPAGATVCILSLSLDSGTL